jgi:uncharacterized protein YbaP (TraB family)
MRKNIVLICLLLFSTLAAQSQLLWKISGNGLKHPSYLFGTHNFIPIQFLDSVSGLYKAFNSCDIIVGEMVMNNIEATAKIQQAAIMPNYIKMKDLLNDDEYKMVNIELNSVLKIGLKEVSIMNPSLILSLYKMELYKKNTGLSDDVQSDSYFQLCAAEKGKKVVGLETVDQQIAFLFENGSLERQADILVESVQHKDSILNEMVHLNKLYKAGKIEELMGLTKGTGKTNDLTPEEYAKLVDNRNADWMTKLPGLFKESPCFVAVGDLHLGGKNGVLNQLQKAGYKVKPVE